jgi:hypothetical protein
MYIWIKLSSENSPGTLDLRALCVLIMKYA